MRRQDLMGAIALAAVLLAGCAAPGPSRPVPAHAQATADARLFDEPLDVGFQVTDCRNPRMIFLVPKAYLQTLLPPGFEALDFAELAWGALPAQAPIGPGSATPMGAVIYDASPCPGGWRLDGLPGRFAALADDQALGWDVLGIFVRPPTMGQSLAPAMSNLYIAHTNWNSALASEWYQAMGFHDGPVAISTDYGRAGDAPTGTSTISDANGILASFSYAFQPPVGNVAHSVYRFWSVSDRGTLMTDMIQDDESVEIGRAHV